MRAFLCAKDVGDGLRCRWIVPAPLFIAESIRLCANSSYPSNEADDSHAFLLGDPIHTIGRFMAVARIGALYGREHLTLCSSFCGKHLPSIS